MKITYTGRHEVFPSRQRAKLEAKLQKLSKLIDRKGEREAHVILSQERFLHKAEITMNVWDHAIVGIGSNRDLVIAANEAIERLEKQILKVRTKFRDTRRTKDKSAAPPERANSAPARVSKKAAKPTKGKKVYRVDNRDGKKPMTLEEAMIEMEAEQDYMVYRDAKSDRVTVLMRRADGHFDLIES